MSPETWMSVFTRRLRADNQFSVLFKKRTLYAIYADVRLEAFCALSSGIVFSHEPEPSRCRAISRRPQGCLRLMVNCQTLDGMIGIRCGENRNLPGTPRDSYEHRHR